MATVTRSQSWAGAEPSKGAKPKDGKGKATATRLTKTPPAGGALWRSNKSVQSTNHAVVGRSASPIPASGQSFKDPFLQRPPPCLTVRPSDSSLSASEVERYLKDDSLLKIEILSRKGQGTTSFYLPVSLVVQREMDMRKATVTFGIGRERWTESLLYREWLYQSDDDASSRPTANLRARHIRGEKTLRLDPERDCAASNHSQSLVWNPWLTTCIRAYYNTEAIRIPDDCNGSDILLALEYFGIVYTPEQLTFDSFGAYLRVKLWSDYYTHRSTMADWVVQKLLKSHSRHSHSFCTSMDPHEGTLLLGNKRVDILDGGLVLDASKYDEQLSAARVLHDFFNDDEQPDAGADRLDALMREDFRAYVQQLLPGTDVSFTLRTVQVQRAHSETTALRAVLHINFVGKSPPPVNSPVHTEAPIAEETPRKRFFRSSPSRKAKTVAGKPEQDKPTRYSIKTSPSADHVYSGLEQHSNTPTPSDEVNHTKQQTLAVRPLSSTPSDEVRNYMPKNNLPANAINVQCKTSQSVSIKHSASIERDRSRPAPPDHIDMYDVRTVASGLTGPWIDEDLQLPTSLIPDLTGMKYQSSAMTSPEPPPKIKTSSQPPPHWDSSARNASLLDTQSVQEDLVMSLKTTSHTELESDQQTTNDRSIAYSNGGLTQQTNLTTTALDDFQCGTDFLTTISSFFKVKKRNNKSKVAAAKTVSTERGTSVAEQTVPSRPTSALSQLESILPAYGFLSETEGRGRQEEVDESMEGMNASWLRNTLTMKNYICSDHAIKSRPCDCVESVCLNNGSQNVYSGCSPVRSTGDSINKTPPTCDQKASIPVTIQPSPVRVMDLVEEVEWERPCHCVETVCLNNGSQYVYSGCYPVRSTGDSINKTPPRGDQKESIPVMIQASPVRVMDLVEEVEWERSEASNKASVSGGDISVPDVKFELQGSALPQNIPDVSSRLQSPNLVDGQARNSAMKSTDKDNSHMLPITNQKLPTKPQSPTQPTSNTRSELASSSVSQQSSWQSDSTALMANHGSSKAAKSSKACTSISSNKSTTEKKRGIKGLFRRNSLKATLSS